MKKLSEVQRIKWRTVFYIIISWVVFGEMVNIHNYFFLQSIIESRGADAYSLNINLILILFIIPIAGLTSGSAIVFFLRDRFRRYPLGVSLLITILTILLLIILLSVPAALIFNGLSLSLPPWSKAVIAESMKIFRSYVLWYNIVLWELVAAITIIVLHINEKYGQGVFFKLLIGKYYRPKVENRIFMFLDIKSSTTIAEKLGHEKWFRLLNDFYNGITEPILNYKGDIYQYVGDEIIVNWTLKKGLPKNNCINCFFAIKAYISQHSDYYAQHYGVVPGFKASIHSGSVTVGEIGMIKKEIIFTGDTLNTSARIVELCNHYKAELLISENLLEQLQDQASCKYEKVGDLELRGRQQSIIIYKAIEFA
jgi:adenylate cyclase